MAVERIHAREILDSRGNPTVEVDLYTHKGTRVRTRDGGEVLPTPAELALAQRVFSSEPPASSKPGEQAETKMLLVALLVWSAQQLHTRAGQIVTRQLAAVYVT